MVTGKQQSADTYRRPRRVMQVALILLILFSGMLIGSAGTILLLRNRMVRAQRYDRSTVSAPIVASKMQQRYDLTDRETQGLERVISKRMHAIAESRQQFLTQLRAARETFLTDLQEVLPPAKYELLKGHLEARRRWFRWFFGVSQEPQEDSLGGFLKDSGQDQSQEHVLKKENR